jgi:hypothetical protein
LSVEGTKGKYECETLLSQLDLLAVRLFLEAHFSLQLQERDIADSRAGVIPQVYFKGFTVKVDLVYFTLSNLSSLPGLMAPLQRF